MIRNKISVCLLLILSVAATAQDTQYSQFYDNPLYLNPAFAGTGSNTRVAAINRILYPNLPQAFTSYSVSIDYHAAPINSGFGLLMSTDKEGTASLKNTTMSFIYSYDINIGNHAVIRPAVQFGYIFRSIDNSQLLFSDQIQFGVDGAPSSDPNVFSINTQNFWDFGTGVLMYTNKYWLGFSAVHLTTPNLSFFEEGEDKLAVRYTIHAGGRYPLGKEMFRGDVFPTIAPNIIYKRQGKFQQLEAGASVHLHPLIFGLYYRGIPLMNDFGRIGNDAIIIHVGAEYKNIEFGYSFDMSMSQFDVINGGGAHEFSLQYGWRLPLNPRHHHVQRQVKCPVHMGSN